MEEKRDILVNDGQNSVLFQDICTNIEQAQEEAYRLVNVTQIKRNWLLGLRIQHEVLKDKRAEYGEQVVKGLVNTVSYRSINHDDIYSWKQAIRTYKQYQ